MDLQRISDINQILTMLDYIGTLVFAISGAMAASSKKLDLFGATFLAFVTAVGGGTVRDLLIGATPVGWMKDVTYLYLILGGVGISFIFKDLVRKLRKTLFLFDTIGIGVFAILGLKKALLIGIHAPIAIILGMFSAVLGGVIRDILINEIPLIFRKEIYALACIAGATLFVSIQPLNLGFEWNAVLSISAIVMIRILALKFKIGLSGIDGDYKKIFVKEK